MADITLIIGESGTGKSSSIRNLDPAKTFVINVLDKPLPFKAYKANYKLFGRDSFEGNYYSSDQYQNIIKMFNYINEKMPHIENVIIDDFQYIMANEFMRRAKEKGFDKFTEIAQHAWNIIVDAQHCRNQLNFFFLTHSDTDNAGKSKCKTIGKMLDEKITLEGMFTVVLHSVVIDNKYWFLTHNNGTLMAKSPLDMFEANLIPNDLEIVKQHMRTYYNEVIDEDIKQ